jgi:hypothetical protein
MREMVIKMKNKFTRILFIALILASISVSLVTAANENNYTYRGGYRFYTDVMNGTYVDWYWYYDNHEAELIYYYQVVNWLTGWNILFSDFVKAITPEAYPTLPEFAQTSQTRMMFHTGNAIHDDGWLNNDKSHIWISPDGYVYNGDRPPYQWLISRGWEEYADHLPQAPAGAPFAAPPYSGTPRTTLPLAKIDRNELQRAIENYSDTLITIDEYYAAMVPCPDAIDVNPKRFDEWDWTAEMKSALSRLGLDPDMGDTRLGYTSSGSTVTVVGMSTSGTMKEWTLVRSDGRWTCDTATEAQLADLLVVLDKIGALDEWCDEFPVSAAMQQLKDDLLERKSLSSGSTLLSATSVLDRVHGSSSGTVSSALLDAQSGTGWSKNITTSLPTLAVTQQAMVRDALAASISGISAENTARVYESSYEQGGSHTFASVKSELIEKFAARKSVTG